MNDPDPDWLAKVHDWLSQPPHPLQRRPAKLDGVYRWFEEDQPTYDQDGKRTLSEIPSEVPSFWFRKLRGEHWPYTTEREALEDLGRVIDAWLEQASGN